MAADSVQMFGALVEWLLGEGQGTGARRTVRRIWLAAVVLIVIGAATVNIVGSLTGYLDVPSDTKAIFIWASALVMAITAISAVAVLIASIIHQLGSILGRGTGKTNVHPD
jgi:hypothetical protein